MDSGGGGVGWTVLMSDIVKDLFSTNFSTENFMMLDGALAYLLAKRYLGKSAGLLFYINIKILRGNKVWAKWACLANSDGSPYINGPKDVFLWGDEDQGSKILMSPCPVPLIHHNHQYWIINLDPYPPKGMHPMVFILVSAKINCGSFWCQCKLGGRGGYFLIRD